jgi:hypothetical protein
MVAGDLLVGFYAGFLAGVLSSAVEEPAYATLFVLPLLFAVGESPPVVALGFTLATGILGIFEHALPEVHSRRPRRPL